MLAVNINDMIMQAMQPADLVNELIHELELHAVALRTEVAKSISVQNRLRKRLDAGSPELQPELESAASLAAEQGDLLDQLEKRIADAKLEAERIAAGTSIGASREISQNISGQFKKLNDYLSSR